MPRTINSTDLTELQPEHAELLLNFVATEEEEKALSKFTHQKEKLDEGERFMFEMLKVERFEHSHLFLPPDNSCLFFSLAWFKCMNVQALLLYRILSLLSVWGGGRYESRLRVMAYIGYFDEIVLTAEPQIETVILASENLLSSGPFK